MGNFLTAR